MKTYLLQLIICFTLFSFVDGRKNGHIRKWVVQKDGKLLIHGTTNLNSFTCCTTNFTCSDTIYLSETTEEDLAVNGSINIAVEAFNCSNSGITKEFKKTLNQKQFPNLNIKLLSFKKEIFSKLNKGIFQGKVEIQLAGVTKGFYVDYTCTESSLKNKFILKGFKVLKFSDFNIKAPEKFGGLLKTKEELTIQFCLNIIDVS